MMQISVALSRCTPGGATLPSALPEESLLSVVAIYCFNRCLDVFLSVFKVSLKESIHLSRFGLCRERGVKVGRRWEESGVRRE